MSKWTVGSHDDWGLGYEGGGNAAGLFVLDERGRAVGAALCAHRGLEPPREELEKRAELFAAAPRLLAAAKELIAALEGSCAQVMVAAGRLQQVIAELEGE